MHEDEESPEDRMQRILREEAEEASKKMREEVDLTEEDNESVKKMFIGGANEKSFNRL